MIDKTQPEWKYNLRRLDYFYGTCGTCHIINQYPSERLGEGAFSVTTMQRALNTIKLQRQQLAEQERKVWNEAIKAVMAKTQADLQASHDCITLGELKTLLKPESEASGEQTNQL